MNARSVRHLAALVTLMSASLHAADAEVPGYPPGVHEIRYPVAADASEQPALYWAPETGGKKVPLLVALHTWSGDYRQAGGEAVYARWCQQQGWIFIHPNFRGPNRTPQALGSDLMVADIRAAVDQVKARAPVDETRIYAVGVSGGGHAALLLAGRTPEIWAGVSAWCGIADVAAWHAETTAANRLNYAGHIEGALGGPPTSTPERLADARHRSPLTWLPQAAGVPLDIAHGIRDGREGSVPFVHSLRAWNAVVPESARLPDGVIDAFYATQTPPTDRGRPEPDPLYGKRPPLFRLVQDNTRVTIFDGGHEIVHLAALNWLAAQRKGQPANWQPPQVGDLKASEADTQSGK
ncbi:MAG: prolyl oligopeptidase family serine peptidase [Verrucomicrobiales bacterium]|nr:prolyl oligopeptidase family serine peptidase [Verrucomicrobiales bacterium]